MCIRDRHQSVAFANSLLVKFITNSPCSFINLYEYRDGLTDIYTIAGFVFIIPVQATAVSYTHLDVYKRQLLYLILIVPNIYLDIHFLLLCNLFF